jgi:hypothetical protein
MWSYHVQAKRIFKIKLIFIIQDNYSPITDLSGEKTKKTDIPL